MTEPKLPSKYDGATIKQTLDDIVVAVVGETYKESMTTLIVTSVLGVLSIGLACYGQFYVAFPQQTAVLIAIVVFNLLLTGAIQAWTWIAGASTLFESTATKLNPQPIIVSSYMERFSIDYTLTVSHKLNPSVKQTWTKSAAQWIREDGSVDRSAFESQVRQTLNSLKSSKMN